MKLVVKDKKEISVPASSLADIAFLLIIFFMVASLFNTAKGLKFDLPKKDTKPKQVERHQVVIVEARQKGTVLIDGTLIKEKYLERSLEKIKKKSPHKALIFKVARKCAYGRFAGLVSILRLSGFSRFAIIGVDE